MGDKFGWQKATARDAARRSSRKYGKRRRRKELPPPTFIRFACPACGAFKVTRVISGDRSFFRCDACQSTTKEAKAVVVTRVGKTGFKR